MFIWIPVHLDTSLDTCSSGHLSIWTPVHLNTCPSGHQDNLDPCVSKHMFIWTPVHLNIIHQVYGRAPPCSAHSYLYIWTLGLYTVQQVCGRVPQGHVLPPDLLTSKQPTGGSVLLLPYLYYSFPTSITPSLPILLPPSL